MLIFRVGGDVNVDNDHDNVDDDKDADLPDLSIVFLYILL